MNEKNMVNDILENLKEKLISYQTAIIEAKNMQLRQNIEQIRNNEESFLYELYKAAEIKGYCISAPDATNTEVQAVKTEIQG